MELADGVAHFGIWGHVPGSVVIGGGGEAGVYGFVFARAIDFVLLGVVVLRWGTEIEGEEYLDGKGGFGCYRISFGEFKELV